MTNDVSAVDGKHWSGSSGRKNEDRNHPEVASFSDPIGCGKDATGCAVETEAVFHGLTMKYGFGCVI